MKKLLPLVLVVFTLSQTGCNDVKTIYSEHQKFGEDYHWYKKDVKTFVIDVNQNSHPFEFVLDLRYASGYFYDKALLSITETDPSGESIRRDVEIAIRDSKGEFIGEKGYDIIDLEYVLDEKKAFPVFGKYTYEIRQVMPDVDPLEFMMEVGLVVRERSEK